MHKMLLIIGRSGSGKSTVARTLSKQYGYNIVESYTTRPQRTDEVFESDHIFIGKNSVKKYKDKMVAYTKIGENEYFVTEDMLYESDIYVIDPNGLEFLTSQNLDIEFIPVYLYVSTNKQMERLLKRGDDAITASKRMRDEDYQFTMFETTKPITINTDNLSIEEIVYKVNQLFKKDEIEEQKKIIKHLKAIGSNISEVKKLLNSDNIISIAQLTKCCIKQDIDCPNKRWTLERILRLIGDLI